MYPILVEWGNVVIPAWHFFFALAAIVAFFLLSRISKKQIPQVQDKDISRIFISGYIGGYFGARILSIVIEQPEIKSLSQFTAALFTLGPMTMYGGAVGCFLGASGYVLAKKLPYGRLFDIAMPIGILAIGIGRIGCFLNGDDFGIPVSEQYQDAWWATTFPNHPEPIARIPVQLLESAFCLIFSSLLLKLNSNKKNKITIGSLGLLSISGYALFRFAIEYWRGDERGWIIEGLLSPSQLISLIILIFTGSLLVVKFAKKNLRL